MENNEVKITIEEYNKYQELKLLCSSYRRFVEQVKEQDGVILIDYRKLKTMKNNIHQESILYLDYIPPSVVINSDSEIKEYLKQEIETLDNMYSNIMELMNKNEKNITNSSSGLSELYLKRLNKTYKEKCILESDIHRLRIENDMLKAKYES
jgi:hypothetical protein